MDNKTAAANLMEAFGRKVFFVNDVRLNALVQEVLDRRTALEHVSVTRNPYNDPNFQQRVALEVLETAMEKMHRELVDEAVRFDGGRALSAEE